MLVLCSLGGKPQLSCVKSSIHHYVEKVQFFFYPSIVLVPKSNFLCPRMFFGKNKLSNNVTWFVKKGSVCSISVQSISNSTMLYCASTCADTHHIKTFGDFFQNNSWVYINLATQFLYSSQ